MSPDDRELTALAARVADRLLDRGQILATAESCTGGWIAKVATDLAGSSDWFGYGLVSYSNDAKQTLLDVPAAVLVEHGAVSEAVVRAMAEGALKHGEADVAVAVSGIAGPTGGTPDKPVGLVWFAWAVLGETGLRTTARVERFDGDRETVRRRTVATALEGILTL
jgi:nicotinamide-nucleotide amidase